ncbi:MAG: polyprenyl synthetase family protein [Solirubrobacteraceae bacterium]
MREFTASPAFANELGVLFQIVNDILDITGSSETLGKQQGSDERLGERMCVTEFGLDGARELGAQWHPRARAALALAARDTAAELEQTTDFIATRSF